MLVQKQYGLLCIQDILQQWKNYKYMTKIDIAMQFYTFELDEESSWLCVIMMPFGKFCYLHLLMGVCNSPNFAQEIMEDIFRDMFPDIEFFLTTLEFLTMNSTCT